MTWKDFFEAFQREGMVDKSEINYKVIKKKFSQNKKLPIPKTGKA